MKILLGGIPLGCDNIGDEAIITCVVAAFRNLFPDARFAVATKGGKNAAVLPPEVEQLPLYGFDPEHPVAEFAAAVKRFDLYVWAGATGLSDYPNAGLDLLEAAQNAHCRTAIWSVGMNDELNPAFFRLHGRKKQLAAWLDRFCFGAATRTVEHALDRACRRRIKRVVGRCEAIVTRDALSLKELRRCGAFPTALSGADSAILLRNRETATPPEFFRSGKKVVAVCVSAQSAVADMDGLCRMLDRLIATGGVRIAFIPMNPITDAELMANLRAKLQYASETMLFDDPTPEGVQTATAWCDLIISSRLHLMILGLNNLVPCIGIARGSKIANFLGEFGLPTVGTVGKCDFDALGEEAVKWLERGADFRMEAEKVHARMLADFQAAAAAFKNRINGNVSSTIS